MISLSHIFKKRQPTMTNPNNPKETIDINTATPAPSQPLIPDTVQKYKFDIDVMDNDVDPDKSPEIARHTGIISDSLATLAALYATCDQKIRLVSKTPINMPAKVLAPPSQSSTNVPVMQPVHNTGVCARPPFVPVQSIPVEPKYLTVSGIKVKIVGDEIFQKQWIRASDEEAEAFRVIAEKTNRVVSMKDRHVEIEKWIKIVE